MTHCYSVIVVLVVLLVAAGCGLAAVIAWGLQRRDRVRVKEGR